MPCDLLGLMREASRRVAAEYDAAILIQVIGSWSNAQQSLLHCPNLTFYFRIFDGEDELSAEIKYAEAKWGQVKKSDTVLGARLNSLLRCEINLNVALLLTRAAGFVEPISGFSLLQPVTGEMPPNPLYAFPMHCSHQCSATTTFPL